MKTFAKILNSPVAVPLRKSEGVVFLFNYFEQIYYKYFFTDEAFVKKRFKQKLGRDLELNNPIKYNDKLQWLKLNWYDPLAKECADKYAVREFVKKRIGAGYLNELYETYQSVDEIKIDKLPKSFVLKATHGSGYNIICKNKFILNWNAEFKKMKNWLRNNYFLYSREWVYKNIKPMIICEKYLEEVDQKQVKDYKIFCFNGEPKIIMIVFDRFSNIINNLYDLNLNFIDVEINYKNDKNKIVDKPKKFEKLIDLSRALSKDFPRARVDFYLTENKIIFGELTFFHLGGTGKFRPEEFEVEMGNWLTLPSK